jgi:hypothetical protein
MTVSVSIIQTEARGFVPGGCAIFAVAVFARLPWLHSPRAGDGRKTLAACIGSRRLAELSLAGGIRRDYMLCIELSAERLGLAAISALD